MVTETLNDIYAAASAYDQDEIDRASRIINEHISLPNDSELCNLFANARQPVNQELGKLINLLARSSHSRKVFEPWVWSGRVCP